MRSTGRFGTIGAAVQSFAPFGIRVVVNEPGLIETGFGDVAADGLTKRPGSGAYDDVTEAVRKSTQAAYGHGRGTSPRVIAGLVSRVVSMKHPRTRYAAGKYAKPMILSRKGFGDRMFDRMIMSQMG